MVARMLALAHYLQGGHRPGEDNFPAAALGRVVVVVLAHHAA